MKQRTQFALLSLLLLLPMLLVANNREKFNFNSQWLLQVGDIEGAERPNFQDAAWKSITLPRPFNEDEIFKVPIKELTDTVAWYRKHFRLPKDTQGKKVFIEFEGVRQAADLYLNGTYLGLHENGVMAFGFDLTPYLNFEGDNVIAVRVDNNWQYKERTTGTPFQWNDSNFNVNYGGITKSVWLHITDKIYQTLPLYSTLQTTGVYVYATQMEVASRSAWIHAESEVRNEYEKPVTAKYEVSLYDYDHILVGTFEGDELTLKPHETATLRASSSFNNLHFWSWGYGYLYNVETKLIIDNKVVDKVITRTGFRKTRFGEGKIWLNDRVIQMKGYAQRSSNEWPGVGISMPAWMSDYSNGMMIEHHANFFRWMHIAPQKQDVESCDRVGVIQVMPAGDAERDVFDRRWEQRTELMRDVVVYYRNHPSILFYESGNESISREHMLEMIQIRNQYDPYGGRAMGSREMLDIREAEWGGEMLYINKSMHHPMFATEYCRDEALRLHWDDWSFPYHKQGEGPLYKNQDATAYNQNQDQFAVELIRRWYDYYRERPGTGRRVSSGGANIIYSDTQTHARGAENYRRSGVLDPLRIPKDGYYAHQVMWNGWVDVENHSSYIIGHWNYTPQVVKPIYVVSTGHRVELFLNGKSQGMGRREYEFLFTFDSIQWEPGTLEAVSYNEEGEVLSRATKATVGKAKELKLTLMQSPTGTFADGSDVAIVQVEVVDEAGCRSPLANQLIHFDLQGPAEWLGGIAQASDNYAFAKTVPVECGITRVLIRTTPQAGEITLHATAHHLGTESISFTSLPVEVNDGLSKHASSHNLPSILTKGETPLTPSYVDSKVDVRIQSAEVAVNREDAVKSFDDNELSEWSNDGRLSTAWITYHLERYAEVDDICIKLTGWRQRSYPLEVYAGDELIWSGDTERSLGYIHLPVKAVRTKQITIRLKGTTQDSDAFGQIVEVVEAQAGELDLFKAEGGDKTNNELRIVEIEFLETIRE